MSITVTPTNRKTTPRRRATLALALAALGGIATTTAVVTPATHAEAASLPSTLKAGSVLGSGARLASPTGGVALVMQADGNLVAYAGGRAIWSSGTSGHAGALLSMQPDGNAVIYKGATSLWSTKTSGKGGVRLSVQDDGNVVVYNSAGRGVWDSHRAFSTLAPGATLHAGQRLTSPDFSTYATLKADSNVVVVRGTTVLWQTKTARTPADTKATLTMQTDGNLVLRSGGGTALWQSRTAGKGASSASLDSLGALSVVTKAGTTTWSSQPAPAFTFPLRTTQSVLKNRPGEDWCYKSLVNCHHDYNAADIFAPTGTPVLAPVAGTVMSVKVASSGVGSRVQIRDAKGGNWYLAHMNHNPSPVVSVGQKVTAGTVLGYVGTSAHAMGTPSHLHIDKIMNRSRPSCSGGGCSAYPFVNVQPQLVAAFAHIPAS